MRRVSLSSQLNRANEVELILIWPPSVTNDAFRTLATDQDFKDKVSEEALVRLLDAFAWSHLGEYA